MRDESGDDKSLPVTLVFDSVVAKGLPTEPWVPPQSNFFGWAVKGFVCRAVRFDSSRVLTWVHVRSQGRENDPMKQHLLPLDERADRLAERGRSGEPCFVVQRWAYTIGEDEPELAVERCRWCRRIFVNARAASVVALS